MLASERPERRDLGSTCGGPRLREVELLIVDDEPEVRDLLARAFARDHHHVTAVGTVEEARRAALTRAHEVVVLDVALPDGSGIDLCRELRMKDVRTPILLLTAHGAVHQRVEGLDAGADDFVAKPFALAELRARVRALARRGPVDRGDTIEVEGVEIDLGACLVRVGADEVPITGREWEVLQLLASRRGRVASRAEVLEGIWGEVSDASSATLDVMIARIRRKLGPRVIRTIRGVGYALGGG